MLERVMIVLAVASHSLCAPYYADRPTDTDEPIAVTFSCPGVRWCNETWRADRILRYNLTVDTVLTENVSEHTGPVFKCNGGQESTDCVLEGSGTTLTMEYRTIVNRTLVSIEELGPEGLLTTDNFNESLGSLEGFYPPNQDKIWQIRIPQNCQLWIVFEEFEIESTEDCEKDYFSVQTSKNQADIRKYCKSLESITVQRRKRVQLWFHADESIERRGLLARYCFRAITQNSTQQRTCNCNQGDSYTPRQRRSGIQAEAYTDAHTLRKGKEHMRGVKVKETTLSQPLSDFLGLIMEKSHHQKKRRRHHTSL